MKLYEKESVNNKLFRLSEITKILDELCSVSKEDFIKDATVNSAAMFNLLIGITIILDIGQHLLAQFASRTAHEYKEVIKYLAEEKVVPRKFAEENESMVSFRNLLVPDYDKIDLVRVYEYLRKAPDIFRQFVKYFVEFMEKQPKS